MYSMTQVLNIHNLHPKTVLHIGAHLAQELEMYKSYGIFQGTFIEANPEVYLRLKESLKDESRWHTIEALLSDVDGEESDFWVSDNDKMSSSLLKPDLHLTEHPDVKFEDIPIKLLTRTLDCLLLNNFELIVMDAQGAELKILKGGMDTIKNADAIWIEVALGGLYKNDCSINDLVHFLSPYGFYPVYVVIGNNLWGDALFVKRDTLIKNSKEKIKENL